MDNGFPITLISHANGNKPETEAQGQCEGIRMRNPFERVHLREDEDNKSCVKCGKLAAVWYSSEDRWAAHSYRCN